MKYHQCMKNNGVKKALALKFTYLNRIIFINTTSTTNSTPQVLLTLFTHQVLFFQYPVESTNGFFHFDSCKDFKNWNTFFAIILGLNNSAVSRMNHTWEVSMSNIF